MGGLGRGQPAVAYGTAPHRGHEHRDADHCAREDGVRGELCGCDDARRQRCRDLLNHAHPCGALPRCVRGGNHVCCVSAQRCRHAVEPVGVAGGLHVHKPAGARVVRDVRLEVGRLRALSCCVEKPLSPACWNNEQVAHLVAGNGVLDGALLIRHVHLVVARKHVARQRSRELGAVAVDDGHVHGDRLELSRGGRAHGEPNYHAHERKHDQVDGYVDPVGEEDLEVGPKGGHTRSSSCARTRGRETRAPSSAGRRSSRERRRACRSTAASRSSWLSARGGLRAQVPAPWPR